jgi:hypothetical protein
VERVIGSIRRECLDHVIAVNAVALHCVLRDYVAYYLRSGIDELLEPADDTGKHSFVMASQLGSGPAVSTCSRYRQSYRTLALGSTRRATARVVIRCCGRSSDTDPGAVPAK